MVNKDREFWMGLKGWDVTVLIKTWVDEKGRRKARGKLLKVYKWGMQWTMRRGKRGRAVGGVVARLPQLLKLY